MLALIRGKRAHLLAFFASTAGLNQFDADAIGRRDVAEHHPRFEFPWLDCHTHAFSLQIRAERAQVAAKSESEVIGPPSVVTREAVEMLHRPRLRRMLAWTLTADDDRHAADADIDLRRAAEIFLHGGDLAPEHLTVPVRGRFWIPAD